MIHLEYKFNGATRVDNSLRTLATRYRKEIDFVVKDFTKDQRKKLKAKKYPPQSRKPQPFKTAKQRRFFFWALSEGIITVPYRRTGTLANSWSARQNGWANWSVGNSAAHAPLVVGKDSQTRYHKGNWWIADNVIKEDVGDLTKDLAAAIVRLAK